MFPISQPHSCIDTACLVFQHFHKRPSLSRPALCLLGSPDKLLLIENKKIKNKIKSAETTNMGRLNFSQCQVMNNRNHNKGFFLKRSFFTCKLEITWEIFQTFPTRILIALQAIYSRLKNLAVFYIRLPSLTKVKHHSVTTLKKTKKVTTVDATGTFGQCVHHTIFQETCQETAQLSTNLTRHNVPWNLNNQFQRIFNCTCNVKKNATVRDLKAVHHESPIRKQGKRGT